MVAIKIPLSFLFLFLFLTLGWFFLFLGRGVYGNYNANDADNELVIPARELRAFGCWMIVSMDLNASPVPEEDEDTFGQHIEEYTAPEERIESAVDIARRVLFFFIFWLNCPFFHRRIRLLSVMIIGWIFSVYLF